MNEPKHTKGPWRIVGFASPGGFGIYSGAIPNAGHYVAEVKSTYLDAHRQGEGDANARLIAAAPDLLAALTSLNHMGGDERGGYCICPMSDGSAPDEKHSSGCADARAAIRKATGEE